MLRQGDEGTSLNENFRKAEIDLPQPTSQAGCDAQAVGESRLRARRI
jgi:hypothetical protein